MQQTAFRMNLKRQHNTSPAAQHEPSSNRLQQHYFRATPTPCLSHLISSTMIFLYHTSGNSSIMSIYSWGDYLYECSCGYRDMYSNMDGTRVEKWSTTYCHKWNGKRVFNRRFWYIKYQEDKYNGYIYVATSTISFCKRKSHTYTLVLCILMQVRISKTSTINNTFFFIVNNKTKSLLNVKVWRV